MFALYEGIQKLIDPHELESPIGAFGVLGLAIVLEGLSLRTAHREATPSRGRRSWWTFIRTTKSPELPVVLLEDSGALVGLLFALVGISLAEITGNARWDAMGSIGIGLLLGVIAVILAIEMKSLLIGEAVAPEVDATIRTAILGGPEISRIIHLRTSHLGPDDVAAGGEAGIHLRHHGRTRRRDRHRRGTCASLGADRSAHLLRTRLLRPEPRGRRGGRDDAARLTRSTASTRRSTVTTSTR